MSTPTVVNSILTLKWLRLRKFCFLFQLQTGLQIYGFTSFLLSILVTDILSISLIEEQMCQGYRSATDLLRCSTTKQNILQQACLALMSAMLLWYKKSPWIIMCWLGCKMVVTILEFGFLLEWGREIVSQLFSVHLNSVWFAVVLIAVYLYGILLISSYYRQLMDNPVSHGLSSTKKSDTYIDIPIPPDLPNL
ncbi:uncharacterized protein LOC124357377 isoform X2 [Homalodisca vitripennis]|nr:uncharacterized protein LOC124357377 isoform X2 [Homalodisca vitripennis]XP_046665075.1 uncharacterized protein LOC124357377 isoform X2 [Homalodisca vitripennis]